jgi:hypothetical protein
MPDAPARKLRLRTSLIRAAGSAMRLLIGKDVEGVGQQGVAGEDRHGGVEGGPDAGLAAPQRVVVHVGQVVVDQRVGMHHSIAAPARTQASGGTPNMPATTRTR